MKRSARSSIEKKLERDHECYVLITCDRAVNGKMNVEMSFGGGDKVLASYLLQGAQNVVDSEIDTDNCVYESELRRVK